jgi:two-component system, chemotaxis family, protein-glutamate methylesterase/glutaminase
MSGFQENDGFGNIRKVKAIIIGSSAGGLQVLTAVLGGLPENYPIPIIIIQHRASESTELLEEVLQYKCRITIKQADEKEKINPGLVYVAPPGYHLLIEKNYTFSLTSDMPVKHSMPSIDVSFESAAEVYEDMLVCIILTGASNDGSEGVKIVKTFKGLTIAQDPREAEYPVMPRAAINTGSVDKVFSTREIKLFLEKLA